MRSIFSESPQLCHVLSDVQNKVLMTEKGPLCIVKRLNIEQRNYDAAVFIFRFPTTYQCQHAFPKKESAKRHP